MTPAQFCDVLAATESSTVLTAWGDNLCAMGEFQAHPAWAWQFANRYAETPTLSDTWNQWIEAILIPFFVEYSAVESPIEVAMRYHKGHECHETATDWDAKYAVRFRLCAMALGIAID